MSINKRRSNNCLLQRGGQLWGKHHKAICYMDGWMEHITLVGTLAANRIS